MDEKHQDGLAYPHQQQQPHNVHFTAAALTSSPTESHRRNSSSDTGSIPSNQRQTADSVSISIHDSSSPQSPLRAHSADSRWAKTMFDDMSKAKREETHNQRRQSIANFAMRGQGVDVSAMDPIFNCIERQVGVTTVDMNQEKYLARKDMDNGQFLEWLRQPRPEWSTVRWININGMSWDIIKTIALEYDLHHLAVEDLLHVPQRTKVDVYPKQCYLSLTLLTLMEAMGENEWRQVGPYTSPHGIDPEMLSQRMPLESLDKYKHQHYVQQTSSSSSKPYGRLHVHMEQVTIFLLSDNTLITLFQVSGETVVNPIVERLSHDYSLVRKHNDSSFLLQSVIDGIVDHAIPITDAFRHEINDLEDRVMTMPKMPFTADLHKMTAQLSLMRRMLIPTQVLVHSLRGKDERSPLTSLAKIYMSDVMDHCNTMVEDIDTMLSLCEKLINMIFNLVAYDTNESMRQLALVSMIFLPITFVAGVYGTNFTDFPELSHNISYFWFICLAVTIFFLLAIFIPWVMGKIRAHAFERRLRRGEPIGIGSHERSRNCSWWP
ncbi:magnesium transporter [Entomortierella parvispora]|uniref:Magnesium transporter n=1 Tax=Entomortierella parvispora TaxID=205924 RepID=A0A9P3H5L3_9FUNG|nr:magnesium transporter [Entomortierella parvispora]